MSRPLRVEYPGAVYHITYRGTGKKPVFRDDNDRLNFLNTFQRVHTNGTANDKPLHCLHPCHQFIGSPACATPLPRR